MHSTTVYIARKSYYCQLLILLITFLLFCRRYFIDEHSLTQHYRTKVHKRRLKALELEPYTIEESERAAGLGGNYKAPVKRKIETILPKVMSDKIDVDQEPDLKKQCLNTQGE